MNKWILLLTYVILCANYKAQSNKLIITPKAYDQWKVIAEPQISNKGNIISYAPKPEVGDQILVIENKPLGITREFNRGKSAVIAPNEKWISFSIANYYDSIKALKLKKTPEKEWKTDTLAIYLTARDSVFYFTKVKAYKTGEDAGDWLAILRTDKFKTGLKKINAKSKKDSKKKSHLPKENGTSLTLFNPLTNTTKTIASVKEYCISKAGNTIYYTTSYRYNDSIDSCFLYRFNGADATTLLLNKDKGSIISLTSSATGEQLSYLFSTDTISEKKHHLFYWNTTVATPIILVDTISTEFDSTKSVSEHHAPYFSDNGNYLFFKVGNKPYKKAKDTLTDDEKYELDLWSWTDTKLQPQQLKNLKKDQKKASLFVYKTAERTYHRLTDSVKINKTDPTNNERYLLASTQTPYLKEMTWDDWYYDYYRVDVETGSKTSLINRQNDQVKLASSGKHAAFYSQKDSAWFYIDVEKDETTQVTKDKYFHDQYYDNPGEAKSVGTVIWDLKEEYLIVKGQYDYWAIHLKDFTSKRLTFGRETKTIYDYWKTNEAEENRVDLTTPIYFKTHNEIDKSEGIAVLKNDSVTQIYQKDKQLYYLNKAKHSTSVLIREMSFTSYPELQLTDLNFDHFEELTTTNPQQKDYNWGTVELVSWESYHNSDSLSGLLYKPENFDSTQRYPMLVYFYERNVQNFHTYYAPRPTASIIHPTEYVSNGYLVFIPDVKYEIGKPGQGAYDCIVSGTKSLLEKHNYIDSTRLGLQGQSWGGYQAVQLITMTNMYKCAMAGAPVSNMFSAYGGMRWGTGLNRAFQYEKGQSRIGQTIWEAPELYIENSPLFHLPKVFTPLLIMHNDGDDAVPWYQGIELFNGLRRLQKPVWMLNYNGDFHNLKKRANKLDLSIRMKSFFDYYLQEKEAPEWILNGRPALQKDQENSH